jgi:hypothetical protein
MLCVIVQMNSDQSAFQRLFTKEITRISDIERLCGQMEQQLITADLPYVKAQELPVETKEMVPDILDRLEASVNKYSLELQEVGRVVQELEASLAQAEEFDNVLIHTGKLYHFFSHHHSFKCASIALHLSDD